MQLPCEIDLKSVSTMLVLDDSLQEKIALSNMLEFKMVSELQPNQDHAVKPSFNVFPRKSLPTPNKTLLKIVGNIGGTRNSKYFSHQQKVRKMSFASNPGHMFIY